MPGAGASTRGAPPAGSMNVAYTSTVVLPSFLAMCLLSPGSNIALPAG